MKKKKSPIAPPTSTESVRTHDVTGTIRRLFPVILKSVMLILLFFVAVAWIYHVCFAFLGVEMMVSFDLPPEIRAMEIDRLSSFESFLANMFRGDLGISSRSRVPVSVELGRLLPCTLLLIGASTIISVFVGVGLVALFALIFKKTLRKPSTFAHSLGGFFSGATPIIALPTMFLFGYVLYKNFSVLLFPVRGLYSIPPPADPVAFTADVAWHLFLPVAVLVSVNVVRVLLAIWSSGLPFTSQGLLKRFLLPVNAIDFASTISALVFVEWIFTLPGLGRWFLNSLHGDYPVLIASFIALAGIAVGLGYITVLFDAIQRLVGWRDNLDGKTRVRSKAIKSQTKNARSILKSFLKKKGLIVGLAFLIIFSVLGVFAPWLTPYDPVGVRPRLAQAVAMPEWVTIFPEYSDYGRTQIESLSWNVKEGSEFVEGWGTSVDIHYIAGGPELVAVELESQFSYIQKAPNEFYTEFRYEVTDLRDSEYSITLTLSAPDANGSWVFFKSPTLTTDRSRSVTADSKDPLFIGLLGYSLQENVGNIIFSQRGNYTFTMYLHLRALSEDAEVNIKLEEAQTVLLGRVHGILGTDYLARDIFAQLIYGARALIIFVFPIALLGAILGLPFGFLAGYMEGWADDTVMPLTDIMLSLPLLPIFLIVIHFYGRSGNLFLLLGASLFLSALAAKAFRNSFLMRPSDQKFQGKTTPKQAFNVLKDLFANFCLTSISLVLLLTSIEFLGGDPGVTTWGMMLQRAFGFGGFSQLAWWWIAPPIACIVLLVLGLLLIGARLEGERI